MNNILIDLRTVDRKRLNNLQERTEAPLASDDIWFIHTVLAQCFLPYRDPKTHDWTCQNGDFSIALMAGHVEDPKAAGGMRIAGLPYGAKPRLFQSYICTQTIKQQSPVIPVERSMSAMMHELGLQVSGGKEGTITSWLNSDSRELTALPLVRVTRLVLGSCVVSSNRRYWRDDTHSIPH